MIVPARGAVHGRNCQQAADDPEMSDDLMGAEVHGLHRDREQDKAGKDFRAQNGPR